MVQSAPRRLETPSERPGQGRFSKAGCVSWAVEPDEATGEVGSPQGDPLLCLYITRRNSLRFQVFLSEQVVPLARVVGTIGFDGTRLQKQTRGDWHIFEPSLTAFLEYVLDPSAQLPSIERLTRYA